jgi:pimeloyl-ACP methyl ester carboxylesterase
MRAGVPRMPDVVVSPAHRAGSGSPLVLLHGLTGSWRIWRPTLALLTPRHDVFVPTVAGHNGGPLLQDAVTVDAMADALEQTFDDAGIGTAHLAGNSLGGWLALELARRGRACSVTALSPAGGWATRRDFRRVTRMFLIADRFAPRLAAHLGWAIRRPRARRLLLRQVMERGDRIPVRDAVELFDDHAKCTIVEELLATLHFDGGFRAQMAHVKVPIRIAWGDRDRTIPFERYGRPLLTALPQAEHVVLAGVGHVPMYDDPALVADTILQTTAAAGVAT